MSSGQEVTLIVDVNDSSASFSDGWQVVEDPAWYGGKAAFYDASHGGTSNDFNMSFHGTSISFYGGVISSKVMGDDNNGILLSGRPEIRTVWYQSPPLPDKNHEIATRDNKYVYIDYALIKAGRTTDFSAQTIFVDNSKEDEIRYTGQWSASVDDMFAHSPPNVTDLPLIWQAANRTASRSNTTGTSISVYGILPQAQNFTVDFIMDDTVQSRKYPQEDSYESDNAINYKFYENMTLSPGSHTLTVNVRDFLEGSAFWLDYITYTPSFSFIHEKPTFIRSSEDQQLPPSSSPVSKSLVYGPIGAVVGSIIAGLIVVACAVVFYHLRTKRSASREDAQITSGIEPFTTRFEGDSKPRPTKWRELFPSEDIENLNDQMGERPQLEPLRIPQNMVEIQERNDEIALLTAQMERSDEPSRIELYATINMLRTELERLVRENSPPEYWRSDVANVASAGRPNSRSGTLPSYDDGEAP
ncbi:hypothetical protein VNI00_014758 [Paramarasmius palmivorus]|uniref:Uncharacterized protein n=1 Tax=Paramarasmius palmivorus TaxID=297713 RepID=A0AAW0BRM3_9AGAR